MKKKVVALLLSATMVMGMGVTVCASSIDSVEALATGGEVTGSGTVELPTIDVTVPTTADIVLNPYQLIYDVDGEDGDETAQSQIISVEQEISSNSDVSLVVNVEDLKAISDTVALSTTALTGGKTVTKSAFLYLEVVAPNEEGVYAFAEAYNAKTGTNQLVVPKVDSAETAGSSKTAVATLAANDSESEDDDTKVAFKFLGDTVVNPTKLKEGSTREYEQDPWTDTDALSVSMKFTFTPQMNVIETETETEESGS